MKNIPIVFVLTLFFFSTIKLGAQDTLYWRANDTNCIDALVTTHFPDSSFDEHRWRSGAWTYNSQPVKNRAYFSFDLTSICDSATILDAKLSLYNSELLHSVQSGSNGSFLRRVTSQWTEKGVGWNNQPTSTRKNEVYLPKSDSMTQDYLNINVEHVIQDMVANPNQSYGFQFLLETEEHYRRMCFASSENQDINLRPELTVIYEGCGAEIIETSIIENTSNDLIRISPNPASDQIRIDVSDLSVEEFTVNISTLNGQEVFSALYTQPSVDVELGNHIESGILLLTIRDENGQTLAVKRVVKK